MPVILRLLAKIGPLHLGVADRLLRRSVGDLLAGNQHDEPRRKAHDRAHDVLDQDDRDALLVEAEQHNEDLLDLGGRQTGHRLVGKQQPRRAGNGAGQLELTHLDLGQIARQALRLVGEPDFREECMAALVDRGAGEPRAVPGIDRIEERNAEIVEKIQAAERFGQLKAAGQPQPGALVGRHAVEPAAVEHDAAAVVVQCAGEAVDQRALARAVGPDQTEPLAGLDRDVDVFERHKTAKAFAQPGDFEDWRGHQRIPARQQACTSPTIPLGAMTTKTISRTPTISRFSAEEIVTVASCWMVPSSTAPTIGPIQLVMPPISGIATLLTAYERLKLE